MEKSIIDDDEPFEISVKDLSEVLNGGKCDFNNLRSVLNEQSVSDEVRAKVWQVLLGVAHKSNPFAEFDDLFDLPEQDSIRSTSSLIFDKLGNAETNRLAFTSDLESVLTLFCKSREIPFDTNNGWADVLQLLCTLKMSKPVLYNIFYAIVTKYIPVGCVKNGRPFDLFRLLLLYHDPVLCSVLDTQQITPDLYANQWFNSLFVATCSLKVALKMWDVYLKQADPFLIFFMALVILINARDQILANKDKPKEETAKFIQSLLLSLSAEDIEDFCQLALHYSQKTPQSFRRDYHGPLFGSNLTQAFENVTVHSLLCLPVSVQELVRFTTTLRQNEAEAKLNYFVVDCRCSDHFHNGHLPGAFSVDAAMIVNDPAKFHDIVQRLETLKLKSFPDSHWCFLGCGDIDDDQDRFLYMVVSFFLQKGVPYVSLARGGFRALHDTLKESLSTRLKAHNVKNCNVCKNPKIPSNNIEAMTLTSSASEKINGSSGSASPAKPFSLLNKMKEAVKIKSAEVKEKMADYVGSTNGQSENVVKHVDSSDRHGKKSYRNAASVFTISEEGSSDELSGTDLPASEQEVVMREKIKLKTWLAKPDVVTHFECQEIDDSRKTFDSHLVLTKTHLFVLRNCGANAPGMAHIKSRRQLSSVLKITSKRQCPELLTFKYGFELTPGQEKVTASERFFVPKAGDCAKSVKMCIVDLLQQRNK